MAALRLFAGPPPAPPADATGAPASAAGQTTMLSVPALTDPLGGRLGAGRPGRPQPLWLPCARRAGISPALARQVDETTCGSAVLSLLAMAGDPRLSAWVAGDPRPRFDTLQLRAHRAASRTGLLPWPQRFGTTPWDAAALARYGAVRYTHRVVGRGERGAAVLRAAVAAAAAGTPVPLFSGGDVSGGWQAAVPRHVVLLVDVVPGAAPDDDSAAGSGAAPADGAGLARVYEPSSATIHTVPVSALLGPERAQAGERDLLTAALGGWPHVVWAVLPRR